MFFQISENRSLLLGLTGQIENIRPNFLERRDQTQTVKAGTQLTKITSSNHQGSRRHQHNQNNAVFFEIPDKQGSLLWINRQSENMRPNFSGKQKCGRRRQLPHTAKAESKKFEKKLHPTTRVPCLFKFRKTKLHFWW